MNIHSLAISDSRAKNHNSFSPGSMFTLNQISNIVLYIVYPHLGVHTGLFPDNTHQNPARVLSSPILTVWVLSFYATMSDSSYSSSSLSLCLHQMNKLSLYSFVNLSFRPTQLCSKNAVALYQLVNTRTICPYFYKTLCTKALYF